MAKFTPELYEKVHKDDWNYVHDIMVEKDVVAFDKYSPHWIRVKYRVFNIGLPANFLETLKSKFPYLSMFIKDFKPNNNYMHISVGGQGTDAEEKIRRDFVIARLTEILTVRITTQNPNPTYFNIEGIDSFKANVDFYGNVTGSTEEKAKNKAEEKEQAKKQAEEDEKYDELMDGWLKGVGISGDGEEGSTSTYILIGGVALVIIFLIMR